MLQRKDPFLKSVANACCILAGWKHWYGNKETRLNEVNYGIAFATSGDEDKKGSKKKKSHASDVKRLVNTLMNAMKKELRRRQTKRD